MPQLNKSIIITYLVLVVITIIGLLCVKFFDISYPLNLSVASVSAELVVSGVGQVDVVPDTANVTAGISVNSAPTASDAQRQINEVNNKIINTVTRLGVAKKDIKTSNYSINPNTVYDNGKNTINGYNANAQVTVKVNNTDLLSQVIQAVTDAGATNVNSSGFTVQDPSKYRQQAREKAIQNAKEQAQKIADELGIHLGRVVNMVENNGASVPVPYAQTLEAFGKSGSQAPAPVIEPGSQTITSNVTLYFQRL